MECRVSCMGYIDRTKRGPEARSTRARFVFCFGSFYNTLHHNGLEWYPRNGLQKFQTGSAVLRVKDISFQLAIMWYQRWLHLRTFCPKRKDGKKASGRRVHIHELYQNAVVELLPTVVTSWIGWKMNLFILPAEPPKKTKACAGANHSSGQ